MSDLIKRPIPLPSPPAIQSPAAVYLAGLNTEAGRRSQRWALRTVVRSVLRSRWGDLETFPWAQLRFEHTQALRGSFAKRFAPATANRILRAVKGTLKVAWQLRQMSHEDYVQAVSIRPVPGSNTIAGRSLSEDEVRALFQVTGGTCGPRDRVILTLAYCCGLRRSEIAGLILTDYDPKTGRLVVLGKGAKVRAVHVSGRGKAHVDIWIKIRGDRPGPLLCAMSRWGKPVARKNQFSASAVHARLDALGTAAKIEHFSPHDLRRTFITRLLERGVDLNTVRQLAGHASTNTTAVYDRRDEKVAKEANAIIDSPV